MELLVAIVLTCLIGMLLNSRIVNNPKMDMWIEKIGNKLF